MVRLVIVLILIACVLAEDKPWVWGKNQRNQRAYNGIQNDRLGNQYYGQEKDREPTTRRPPTGQKNEEDFLNPDDLRNFNGPPNFGFSPLGPGVLPTNNFQPGYGPTAGGNNGQGYPTNGYPNNGYPLPNYPTAPGGGGYPVPYPGGYQPTAGQGAYPNQGYPQVGPYPLPTGGGFPGLFGLPGLGSLFGLSGGYQGQGAYPGQQVLLNGNPGNQGGYPYPGVYPNQSGFPTPTGYPAQPGQYQPNGNYPQQGGQYPLGQYPPGQYPTGQYVGCNQFGGPQCAGAQQGQYPGQQFPGQYPNPYALPAYPGQNPTGPFGITPYTKAGGYATGSDDYDDKNTNNTNKSLKSDSKTFDTASSVSRSHTHKVRRT